MAMAMASRAGAAVGPPVAEDPGSAWSIAYPRATRLEAAPPGSAESILSRFFDLHSAFQYEQALAAADELVAAAPGASVAHYNRACALARLRRRGDALDTLERAIDAGWRQSDHSAIDPDLAPLRADPRFGALLERMRSRAAAEAIAPGPLRADAIEVVAADLAERAPSILQRYDVPGVAVCVLREGRVAWVGAFGRASSRGEAPMTCETQFALRAPRDLVALVAGARLHEDRLLDLADLLLRGNAMLARGRDTSGWRVATPNGAATAFGRAHQLEPPPAPADGARAAGVDRWPLAAELTELSGLLVAAIELAGRDSFVAVSRERVLVPAGLIHAAVDGQLVLAQRPVGTANADPVTIAGGCTLLGTPLPRAGGPGTCTASARDLGRLVEVALGSHPGILEATGADLITGAAGLELFRLGLRVWGEETVCGTRVQVAGIDAGAGCLLRWYPEHGSGVVVVFNGAGGGDAALHLAHAAIGGG